MQLLNQTLEKSLPAELADKCRLRLGDCLLAKSNPKGAMAQFDAVLQNAKSPLAPEARYRAGECWLQLGAQSPKTQENWDKAIQYLLPFRDQQPLQNVLGLSDRAVLRLGHAYAHAGNWDASRQTMEILVTRFPQSPWIHEGRYGVGWALQNQKQYDPAVNAYVQVANGTASEVAAKAQLQIGLCRMEQKRHAEAANALLVVPFTYEHPEWSALALCEASRAFVEMKQPEQAAKLLEKVLKDHPQSPWANVARQRLAEIKGDKKG
jgi:tetratricopeptide (TPR) repeat protein